MSVPGSCPACGVYAFAIKHEPGCRLSASRLQKGDRLQMLTGRFLVLEVERRHEAPEQHIDAREFWGARTLERLVVKAQDESGHQREIWFGSGDIAWPDGEYPQPPAQEEHRTWAEWRKG